MAAAAITPRESETAFIPFCFPGVILIVRPLERSRSIRGILAREVKIGGGIGITQVEQVKDYGGRIWWTREKGGDAAGRRGRCCERGYRGVQSRTGPARAAGTDPAPQ